MHYKTKLKILWSNSSVIGKVIVYYWKMQPPITITITITGIISPDYYYYYYYYSWILQSLLLLLLLLRHKCFITITITISNSLTTLVSIRCQFWRVHYIPTNHTTIMLCVHYKPCLVLSCLVLCTVLTASYFFRRSSYLDTSYLVRRAVAPLYIVSSLVAPTGVGWRNCTFVWYYR